MAQPFEYLFLEQEMQLKVRLTETNELQLSVFKLKKKENYFGSLKEQGIPKQLSRILKISELYEYIEKLIKTEQIENKIRFSNVNQNQILLIDVEQLIDNKLRQCQIKVNLEQNDQMPNEKEMLQWEQVIKDKEKKELISLIENVQGTIQMEQCQQIIANNLSQNDQKFYDQLKEQKEYIMEYVKQQIHQLQNRMSEENNKVQEKLKQEILTDVKTEIEKLKKENKEMQQKPPYSNQIKFSSIEKLSSAQIPNNQQFQQLPQQSLVLNQSHQNLPQATQQRAFTNIQQMNNFSPNQNYETLKAEIQQQKADLIKIIDALSEKLDNYVKECNERIKNEVGNLNKIFEESNQKQTQTLNESKVKQEELKQSEKRLTDMIDNFNKSLEESNQKQTQTLNESKVKQKEELKQSEKRLTDMIEIKNQQNLDNYQKLDVSIKKLQSDSQNAQDKLDKLLESIESKQQANVEFIKTSNQQEVKKERDDQQKQSENSNQGPPLGKFPYVEVQNNREDINSQINQLKKQIESIQSFVNKEINDFKYKNSQIEDSANQINQKLNQYNQLEGELKQCNETIKKVQEDQQLHRNTIQDKFNQLDDQYNNSQSFVKDSLEQQQQLFQSKYIQNLELTKLKNELKKFEDELKSFNPLMQLKEDLQKQISDINSKIEKNKKQAAKKFSDQESEIFDVNDRLEKLQEQMKPQNFQQKQNQPNQSQQEKQKSQEIQQVQFTQDYESQFQQLYSNTNKQIYKIKEDFDLVVEELKSRVLRLEQSINNNIDIQQKEIYDEQQKELRQTLFLEDKIQLQDQQNSEMKDQLNQNNRDIGISIQKIQEVINTQAIQKLVQKSVTDLEEKFKNMIEEKFQKLIEHTSTQHVNSTQKFQIAEFYQATEQIYETNISDQNYSQSQFEFIVEDDEQSFQIGIIQDGDLEKQNVKTKFLQIQFPTGELIIGAENPINFLPRQFLRKDRVQMKVLKQKELFMVTLNGIDIPPIKIKEDLSKQHAFVIKSEYPLQNIISQDAEL